MERERECERTLYLGFLPLRPLILGAFSSLPHLCPLSPSFVSNKLKPLLVGNSPVLSFLKGYHNLQSTLATISFIVFQKFLLNTFKNSRKFSENFGIFFRNFGKIFEQFSRKLKKNLVICGKRPRVLPRDRYK